MTMNGILYDSFHEANHSIFQEIKERLKRAKMIL